MLSSKPHTAECALDKLQNDEGPRHIPDPQEYHAPVMRNTHTTEYTLASYSGIYTGSDVTMVGKLEN